MNDIKQSLKNFYNLQAEKFSQTRQKKWPEFDIILKYIYKYINDFDKKEIKIMEFGCGDGRFFGFLKDNLDVSFEYIGVDLSDKLIHIAKSNYPDANFIIGDMNDYISNISQQSIDIVVSIASFQHLPNFDERISFLKEVYRILEYGGLNITVNWSFSKWFVKKYYKSILFSLFKMFISFGYYDWRNIYIPWKGDDGKIYKRFYHIFLLSELERLFKLAGFLILDKGYISNRGKIENSWYNARNTFIVGQKEIIY